MSKIPASYSRLLSPRNRLLGKITSSKVGLAMLAGLALGAVAPEAKAASGTWTLNNTGNWSGTANWAGGIIADGVGSTADLGSLDITAGRTVTIDTTSRTVGLLLLGDSGTAAPSSYILGASGGASLIFDNGGSGATLNQTVPSGANTVSAPIILNDNLAITNSSTNALTISGSITGAKTITNSGTGVGGTTINGVIASGVTGVVQNSANSILTLGGANLFTTGVQVKNGTVVVSSNAGLGSGTTKIGDTSGSADATVLVNTATITNAILAQAGSSGNTLTLGVNGSAAARINGSIQLDNALTFSVASGGQSGRNSGAYFATTGLISGTGNLNINVSGAASTTNNTGQPQMDSLSVGGTIASTGLINNTGTGSGRAIITGNITSASGLNQNSATSMLSLSGTNTYAGATTVNAGVLRIAGGSALSANSAVTVNNGATLLLGVNATPAASVTISGTGTSYSYGALELNNTIGYTGLITLANDATITADYLTSGVTTGTLSGGITGSGKNLTLGGYGNMLVTGAINTGTGALVKNDSGQLTLSGSNSFTGLTSINGGTVLLNNANALAGGGNISFNGGALRFSSSNTADYGSRIINSTGPVALDTNALTTITVSNVGASNTGGLTKLGAGRLTLSGTNSFSGPIAVNAGVLAVSSTSALPSVGTGLIFIDKSGALNSDGAAYANVQAWLNSGNISTASTGAIALTGASSENIDFTGYSNLSLGASVNSTYTGTLTPAGSTYRLGGGGANLTLSAANTLSGTRSLVVSSGTVTISNSNNLSGATAVNSGVLILSGTAGSLANSDITVNGGSTLTLNGNVGTSALTRASSVTLSRGTLAVTGSTSNAIENITNALNIGAGGNSTITLTPGGTKNLLVTAGSLTRSAGGIGLIRGAGLGVNVIGLQAPGAANMLVANPNLVGGTGSNTTDGGILVGFVGDTTTGGTGFGTTGGLLTSDTTSGIRLLSASEYKTSITDGQTQLDNVRLSGTTGSVQTTTLNANTTINSLSIRTSSTAGSGVAVNGTGTLTLNSGVIYATAISPAVTTATVSNDVSFNGREGIVLVSGTVNLSGALSNTGGNGLTLGGPGRTILSGATANTYTGTTSVNAGTLELAKTAGVNAIAGDLAINTGGVVTLSAANQIADSASVFVNGGNFVAGVAETINNLSLSSGGSTTLDNMTINGSLTASGTSSINTTAARTVNVVGSVNLSDGANLEIARSQNIGGAYDTVVAVGGLNITNQASGAYTAVTIDTGVGLPQSGGKLILNGDVSFTGNTTNSNTVLIDAIKNGGRQGVVELNGVRSFNIGDGAAKTDLRVTAGLTDGASTGGVIKTGAGTLDLSGASTYTGATTISAGTLLLNGSSVSAVQVNAGVFGGTGTVSNSVTVANGATVAPGNNGVGMLNTGNLTLSGSTSNMAFEIGGTGVGAYDRLNVTGAVNLNGQITLSLLAYTPTNGDLLFLILNDGNDAINGTLFGLAQGATFSAGGFNWQVSYTGDSAGNTFTGGNDLALLAVAVPEPQTWALLGAGATMLLVFRRRRLS